jgi:hypothetical protein
LIEIRAPRFDADYGETDEAAVAATSREAIPKMTIGIIERAYELARTGRCRTMDELRRQLIRDGYDGVSVHLHVRGRLTKGQLMGMMAQHARGDADQPERQPGRSPDQEHAPGGSEAH